MIASHESFKLTDNSKVRFRKAHKNTFSLSQGLPENGGSCCNATAACLKVCYDATLRRIYKNYRAVEDYNYALVKYATKTDQTSIIRNTVSKWLLTAGAKDPYFRIHTGGEFFEEAYTQAWKQVILEMPDVKFWAYTRSLFVLPILAGLQNLTLMLSCDEDNKEEVLAMYDKYKTVSNIAVAWMGNTLPENFPIDRSVLTCPEITGKMKNLAQQGVCSRCRACIDRPLKSGQISHIKFPIHR